jgi:RNA 3'-terminal phosphate cyclase
VSSSPASRGDVNGTALVDQRSCSRRWWPGLADAFLPACAPKMLITKKNVPGQIVRNTIALAALLDKAVSIENIRLGRTPPGLKAQSVAGLELVARISSGSELVGATKGSLAIYYRPGSLQQGSYSADPGTAGSITLLLQIALPCLLFAAKPTSTPSLLSLSGGTNATQVYIASSL